MYMYIWMTRVNWKNNKFTFHYNMTTIEVIQTKIPAQYQRDWVVLLSYNIDIMKVRLCLSYLSLVKSLILWCLTSRTIIMLNSIMKRTKTRVPHDIKVYLYTSNNRPVLIFDCQKSQSSTSVRYILTKSNCQNKDNKIQGPKGIKD